MHNYIKLKFSLDGVSAKVKEVERDLVYDKLNGFLADITTEFKASGCSGDFTVSIKENENCILPNVIIEFKDGCELSDISIFLKAIKPTLNKSLKRIIIINKEKFYAKCEIESDIAKLETKPFLYSFGLEHNNKNKEQYKEELFNKLKKIITSLAIASLATACGSDGMMEGKANPSMPPLPKSDEFFAPFVQKLEKEFSQIEGKKVKFDNIPFIFSSEAKGNAIAACVKSTRDPNYKFIAFNPELEYSLKNDLEKNTFLRDMLDLTLKHEIGHCYYLMEHDMTIKLTKENVQHLDSESSWFAKPNRIGEIKAYVPQSIMYPIFSHVTIDNYKKYKDHYDKNLVGINSQLKNVLESKLADLVTYDSGVTQYRSPSKMNLYVLKDNSGNILLETTNSTEFYNEFYQSIMLKEVENEDSHEHDDDILNEFNVCND